MAYSEATRATVEMYDKGYPDVFTDHFAGTASFIDQMLNAHTLAGVRPGESRIVEVGSGDGRDAAQFASEGLYGSYVGFEPAPSAVRISQDRHLPNADFQVGYAQDFPSADASADIVLARNSLLHVPKAELPQTLGHISTVLSEGGVLIAETKIEPVDNEEVYHDKFAREDGSKLAGERVFYHHSIDTLRRVAGEAGLRAVMIEEQEVGTKPWNWGRFAFQK